MRLTSTQKTVLANRFWQLGEDFTTAVCRKGFGNLKYSQFYQIINEREPKKPIKKQNKPYIDPIKQKFNSCFMAMTEDEQINFRSSLPIPEETKQIFRTGRLAAYYSNPI